MFDPRPLLRLLAILLVLGTPLLATGAVWLIDLALRTPGNAPVTRVLGPDADSGFVLGAFGVSVAAGGDLDGDGFEDSAVAHMRASPLGRAQAGRVSVVFGNGTIGESIDLEAPDPRVLRIYGSGNQGARELAGSEIWLDDVTGDGWGDLLIGRQNYSLSGRIGAGALTIIVGGPELRALADAGTAIDLASPPPSVTILTLIGRQSFARLGVWMRSGDVDGDGVADIVVAADQESGVEEHHGAVYVIRGGAQLAVNAEIDLAGFGSTALAGQLSRIVPPVGSDHFHFGATCQIGDLDGNGRAEVMAAAALNRAGASIGPFTSSDGSGGAPFGRAYVVWDDVFPAAPWPAGFTIDLQTITPASLTMIDGTPPENGSFGEEILGGLDYTGDGNAELFLGDLVGDGFGGTRNNSGIGYVFYDAASIKGTVFDVDNLPAGVAMTKIIGPSESAIGADTAEHGDFNGDGIADLALGTPRDDPEGRLNAGSVTVFLGRNGQWPALIDTAPGAFPAGVDVVVIEGRLAQVPGDFGDTTGYSAAIGDLDDDGIHDIVVNEMLGNGQGPQAVDSGNMLWIAGSLIASLTSADFVRGDVNADGQLDIGDVISGLDHLFNGLSLSCQDALDANDDESLDISDPIFLLATLFTSGPFPAPPHPGCGPDPAGVGLGCGSFAGCP